MLRIDISTLQNGDLLLFNSNSFPSRLIKFFTRSEISHVAMVWVCPITEKRYLWECGSVDDFKNMITRKHSPMNAAHLIPIGNRIQCDPDLKKIYLRRLITNKKIDRDKLDQFIVRNLGKFYLSNLVSVWTRRNNPFLIPLPFIEMEEDDEDSIEQCEWNCIQLVMMTWHEMKIIPSDQFPFSEYVPGDLFSNDIITRPGYHFDKPVIFWECD